GRYNTIQLRWRPEVARTHLCEGAAMPTSNRSSLQTALPTVLIYLVLLVAGVILLWRLWPSIEQKVGLGRQEHGGDPTAAPRPVAPAGPLAPDEQATIDLYNRSKDSVVNVTS